MSMKTNNGAGPNPPEGQGDRDLEQYKEFLFQLHGKRSLMELVRRQLLDRESARLGVGITEGEIESAVVQFWDNYVERLNGSIRRECTDHVIVFGENHLRRILRDYFGYYHEDRTHLGLAKETPKERQVSNRGSPNARLVELPRVGGLHHRYEWREAA